MNKANSILAVFAALAGIGATWLYRQNTALDAQIRNNAEQCEQQIATLGSRYQEEIDDLRGYLLEQYQSPAQAEAAASTEKTRFNQLISAAHRMQAVSRKYEFLLGSALLDDAGKKQLRELLYRWEQLADSVGTEKTPQLADTEARIRELLTDPVDYQHFLTQRQRNL